MWRTYLSKGDGVDRIQQAASNNEIRMVQKAMVDAIRSPWEWQRLVDTPELIVGTHIGYSGVRPHLWIAWKL